MWLSPAIASTPTTPPAALLRRFDRSHVRDLALPALGDFTVAFGAIELRQLLAEQQQRDAMALVLPLHLLVRLPGAGCPDAVAVSQALAREASALAGALGRREEVARLTIRACDRTEVDAGQVAALVDLLAARFHLQAAEICVEATAASAAALRACRSAGVSRVILGSIDVDGLDAARACGMSSVTLKADLGGKRWDGDRFFEELQALVAAGISRVMLCVQPEAMPVAGALRLVGAASLSRRPPRGELRARAIEMLRRADLLHVGAGLFARQDDLLVLAREHGRLHLEIGGLAARPTRGTLALGVGTYGRWGAHCYRNARDSREYVDAVVRTGLSATEGVTLSREAIARLAIIAALVCHGRVDFESIALAHLLDLKQCFAQELRELAPLARAGLVDMDSESIELTAPGEHLVEVIAAVFQRTVC